MFAVEMTAIPFYARLSPRAAQRLSRSERAMQQKAPVSGSHDLICAALAEMVPSTAEEIAEATGLAAGTVEACLEGLTARCRVMFNPLTKRYSLPKVYRAPGLAA